MAPKKVKAKQLPKKRARETAPSSSESDTDDLRVLLASPGAVCDGGVDVDPLLEFAHAEVARLVMRKGQAENEQAEQLDDDDTEQLDDDEQAVEEQVEAAQDEPKQDSSRISKKPCVHTQAVCPICHEPIGYYPAGTSHFALHTTEECRAVPDEYFMKGCFKRCASCAVVFWSTRCFAPQWSRCALHRRDNSTSDPSSTQGSYVPSTPLSTCESQQLGQPQPRVAPQVTRESAVMAAPSRPGVAQPGRASALLVSALSSDLLHALSSWDVAIVASIPRAARPEVAETFRWVSRLHDAGVRYGLHAILGKLLLRQTKADGAVTAGTVVRRCALLKTDTVVFLRSILEECVKHKQAAKASRSDAQSEADQASGAFDSIDEEDELGKVGLPSYWSTAGLSSVELDRLLKLFGSGQFSRAASSLRRSPLAPFSIEVRDLLQKLHPQGTFTQQPLPMGRAPPPSVSAVVRALNKFNKGTAAGPSGLRPDHLKELVNCPGVQVGSVLASLLGDLINGGVPQHIRPFIFGARLVALLKREEDGSIGTGIRPVACGDAIRRLACKLVASMALAQFKPMFLKMGQVGFGVKDGVPSAALAATLLMEEASQHAGDPRLQAFLKSDLSNAFNRAERSVFLTSPELLKCLQLKTLSASIYGQPTHLWFGEHLLQSSQGTHQGCPLGGLLFALVLNTFREQQLEAAAMLTTSIWVADDGLVGGSAEAVETFFKALVVHGPAYGLYLNAGKCKLYGSDDCEALAARLGVTLLPFREARFCGVACGDVEARAAQAEAVAERICSLNRLLCQLGSVAPQESLVILRMCSSFAKGGYFMRALGPQAAWSVVDTSTASVLAAICPGVVGLSIAQAALPFKLGGLGLRSLAQHADCAFVAASLAAESLLPHLTLIALDVRTERFRELRTHLAPGTKQKQFSTQRDLQMHAKLLQDYTDAEHDTSFAATVGFFEADKMGRAHARIAAASQPGCGMWLNPPASCVDVLALHPHVFRAMLRLRLGLPLFPGTHSPLCNLCRKVYADNMGDHTLLCLGSGAKTLLHHDIRDVLCTLFNVALLRPAVELHTYFAANLRADVTATMLGTRITLDVTATHALRTPYLSAPRLAVHRVEQEKKDQMGPVDPIIDRVAAFDTFGGMTDETRATLKQACAAYAARFDAPREATLKFWATIQGAIIGGCGGRVAVLAGAFSE